MNITLKINGTDLSSKLATYKTEDDINYRKIITTLDDTEHAYPGVTRTSILFSLLPLTDDESATIYTLLSPMIYDVVCTVHGQNKTLEMRLNSSLESLFLLQSVDGKRRYRGGTIALRGVHGVRNF